MFCFWLCSKLVLFKLSQIYFSHFIFKHTWIKNRLEINIYEVIKITRKKKIRFNKIDTKQNLQTLRRVFYEKIPCKVKIFYKKEGTKASQKIG